MNKGALALSFVGCAAAFIYLATVDLMMAHRIDRLMDLQAQQQERLNQQEIAITDLVARMNQTEQALIKQTDIDVELARFKQAQDRFNLKQSCIDLAMAYSVSNKGTDYGPVCNKILK